MTNSFSLFAGWLIDGMGGPVQRNVMINVKNGLIDSIRDITQDDLLQADIIKLPNCTVLPGLIDCHVHLFMSGVKDPDIRRQQLHAPFKDMRQVIYRHLCQQLIHGVVAVRDGGDYAGHARRYKEECLPQKGLPICMKTAGKAWRAPGRYGKLIGRAPSRGTTLAQAILNTKTKIDHVKIVNSGLNSLTCFGKETSPQFGLDQLKLAVKAADDLGLKTMVHANGKLPVRLAVEAGCHSIEHGFFMGRDNLKRMADKQTTWVPTAFTMKAYHALLESESLERKISRKNLDHQLGQINQALDFGTPIAVGTDCGSLGVHHGAAVKEEVLLLIRAGFSLEAAVKSATLNGASLLGLENEYGRLIPKMPATFVVVRGDISHLPDFIDTPEEVFIRGEKMILTRQLNRLVSVDN